MNQDEARRAAVETAIQHIQPGMTIGLGSGRAVFALTRLIGERRITDLKAIVASPATRDLAIQAGLEVVDLEAESVIDVSVDGADEIDRDFVMIKGGGAALLPEKLVLSAARRVVIMIEENKIVEHLGDTHTLPIEIVRFGWPTTRRRLLDIVETAELRMDGDAPVVTSEGHFLLDTSVPHIPAVELAKRIKLVLGVVEHGLFLDQATEVIVGRSDGTIEVLTRP